MSDTRAFNGDEPDPAPADTGDQGDSAEFDDGAFDDLDDAPLNDQPVDDTEIEDPEATSLSYWEGDEGELNYDQRRTLIALLRNRFITADKHSDEWRTLLDAPNLFQSRLNDVFLELHIDYHHQVAFKRQAAPEATGRTFPTLLHDTAYSREETILLAYLRMKFRTDQGNGQVFVDREELLEHVAGFRPDSATDVSGDTRKTNNAVENIRKAGILIPKGDPNRFQVSQVIEVLITPERFEELLTWLISVNGDLGDPADDLLAISSDPSVSIEPLFNQQDAR